MGDMVDTEDMVDMDMDVSAAMLTLNHLQLLIMAMEDTADMDMVANADLLKLLQKLPLLHITDMVDTEDMVDTDMDVNDDLLSPIMDMEVTEDMDTDMVVKLNV